MEMKKISFGFSKVLKKPNLLSNVKIDREDTKVQLIKCLEGQEIKLVEEKKKELPLVIPLKSNQKTPAAIASLMKRRAVLLGEDDVTSKEAQTNNTAAQPCERGTDLEKRAEQELLTDAQNNAEDVANNTDLVLPIVKPDELPLDGAKESTLNDYESIPVHQFGLAMLRGMGWDETKKNEHTLKDEALFPRPKGMGLGADKALKAKPLLVQPETNEKLEIKKQAYVRILGGKYKDAYGQIEGFDDHAGRVIVRMAIGGAKEALNEFLCRPVPRQEYSEYGKCINTLKYEKYKKMENENGQIIKKNEEKSEKNKMQQNSSLKDERSYIHKEDSRDKYNGEKEKSRQSYKEEQVTESSSNRQKSDQEKTLKYEEARNRHKSRSPDRRHKDIASQSSSRNRHKTATSKESSHTSDSTGSSDSDDSAYEWSKHTSKHKSSRSKSTKKSKKSRSRTKHKKRYSSQERSNTEDTSPSDDECRHRRNNSRKHAKKTKKSKRHRSRSRSKCRR